MTRKSAFSPRDQIYSEGVTKRVSFTKSKLVFQHAHYILAKEEV
jgi:hypothetical protein